MALLFQIDLVHASQASASFLHPFKPSNIYGKIVYFIFGFISLSNVIVYILSGFDKYSHFEWNWMKYILSQMILFWIVSFGLELQFFVVCYRWHFVRPSGDSSLRGGIYGFLKHFSKLIWRTVFVLIKSIIFLIFMICQFWNYREWFWQYIFPFCVQAWCLGIFLQRLSNRPVIVCCMVRYRKFVEYFYIYAGEKAKERNDGKFALRGIRWAPIKEQKKPDVVTKMKDQSKNQQNTTKIKVKDNETDVESM